MMGESQDLFLGLDLSTQKLKAAVIDGDQRVVAEQQVDFERELPQYPTKAGIIQRGKEVTSPTLMWVAALDLLFEKLEKAVEVKRIKGISGAGQQHGSVYWARGASKLLENLRKEETLHNQLKEAFAVADSPIWMDSSTSSYCRALEQVVGGPEKLAKLTGSRGYERFTGNQIAKIVDQKKEAYDNCERISLVSSFIPSILCGKYAQIDYSDGSGMNLLDIHSKSWDAGLLNSIDPELAFKLGAPIPTNSMVGRISPYFVHRFGFSEECQIITFTGDNPSSLAGMRLETGDILVSLGTSDTLFLSLKNPSPKLEGHIFCNPVEIEHYMALLCYQNGSLTREWARDTFCNGSWETFNKYLRETKAGLDGKLGFYFLVPEITPTVDAQIKRFDGQGKLIEEFGDPAIEVKALIEGHFLALRFHSEKMGFQAARLLVTGGASQNKEIIQILSDVFGVPIYFLGDISNSASLGGCFRAHDMLHKGEKSHSQSNLQLACHPNQDHFQTYSALLPKLADLEEMLKCNQR